VSIPAGTLVPREARNFGGYELIAKLATGGMAEIFLARRGGGEANREMLVVKRILPHLAEDDHFVTMFRDEAMLASRLDHPNVGRVHALSEAAGTWFIVMEYLHGVALSRMLSKLAKGRAFLDFRVVAALICQACEGLHHAHELRDTDGHLLGLVHRDVSPPNIFVTSDGLVKLLDFGIAKARGASSKTRTGTVKGKNAYMSPEQILGKPLDRRSDIFALGAVTYELIAVKRLFHRDSDFLTFKAITEEPIPEIRERRQDIPAALRSVIIRSLARDPNGRFPTALDFAQAIRHAVAHLGGPLSKEELARFVQSDFSDELTAKDKLVHEIDTLGDNDATVVRALRVNASDGIAVGPTVVQSPRGRSMTSTEELDAVDGEIEMIDDDATRPLRTPDRTPPSMIVSQTPGSIRVPPPAPRNGRGSLAMPPSAAAGTIELGDPVTDLLGDRRKRLRNLVLIGAVAVAALVGIYLAMSRGERPEVREPDPSTASAATPPEAKPPQAAAVPAAAVDAGTGPSRDDIVALSRFGFFSLDADAKTTVFIDGKRIGEAPLTRLPLPPGIHKIKALGPRNKVKRFEITIEATKDIDYGTIAW